MTNKHVKMYVILAVLAVTSLAMGSAYAAQIDEQTSVPRYGEKCAHGHNGFDCNPPQNRVDIEDLQSRVGALEKRVFSP